MAEETRCQEKHTDLNDAIATAQGFTGRVDQTVDDLQTQNEELNSMVETLKQQNEDMNHKINDLEDDLREAARNCVDPDSPEAMAGEAPPPIDKNKPS